MVKLLRIINLILLALLCHSSRAQVGRGFFPSSESGNGLLDDLQAYWKMDEASGNLLDAHGGHTLTEYSAIDAGTGLLNGDRLFDVTAGWAADATWNEMTNSSWTFTGWFFLEDLGGAGSRQTLATKQANAAAYSYAVEYFHAGDGTKSFAAYISTDGTTFTRALVTPSPAIVIDTWYFVAARFTTVGNEMTVSFGLSGGGGVTHGTPVAQGGSAADNSEAFAIGGAVASAGASLSNPLQDDAAVDECALWKRALTSDDIDLVYNGGTPLPYSSFQN